MVLETIIGGPDVDYSGDDKYLQYLSNSADPEIAAMYRSNAQSPIWDKALSFRRVIGLSFSLIKKNTGYLVEWSEDGFSKINGSEGSGSNGIALDRKKNIIYINYNQGDRITKFDLNTNTKVDKKFIEAPDNPYIDGDYVWVTSLDFQPNDFGRCEFDISCSLPFSVYKLDKNNLETINKYSFSKSVFGLPTVAVPFNNEIYLGSFHSDRIGIVKTN